MTIVKKNYYPFAFENTQNLVIFSMKVIFVERELLVPVDLSRVTFWGTTRKFFCPSLFNTYSEEIFTQY